MIWNREKKYVRQELDFESLELKVKETTFWCYGIETLLILSNKKKITILQIDDEYSKREWKGKYVLLCIEGYVPPSLLNVYLRNGIEYVFSNTVELYRLVTLLGHVNERLEAIEVDALVTALRNKLA